jgi:hypothetical protein
MEKSINFALGISVFEFFRQPVLFLPFKQENKNTLKRA